MNKIVGFASSGTRGELASETMRAWREDPVFKECYHEVGEVSGLCSCQSRKDIGVDSSLVISFQWLPCRKTSKLYEKNTKQPNPPPPTLSNG